MRSSSENRLTAAAWLVLAAGLLAILTWRQPPAVVDYGFRPDPQATAKFLAELDKPFFAEAGREIITEAKRRDTFLYRYADDCHQLVYQKPYGPWRQGIGDCVSFGWALGVYIASCVDYIEGEIPEPPLVVATEPIYGGARCEQRGVQFAGWSDGATGSGAARWVRGLDSGIGGVLFRQDYGRGVNLTVYDPDRAKQYGAYGCGGKDNDWLDKVANEHTAREVALIKTYDEACAAIEAGMPVVICCNIGWSSQRDEDGFARRSGRWLHCQAAISVRYKENEGGRDGILIMNSWGAGWNRGGRWPSDQPDGSYWCDPQTFQAVLSQGESFAVSGVNGFKWRNLDHKAWIEND